MKLCLFNALSMFWLATNRFSCPVAVINRLFCDLCDCCFVVVSIFPIIVDDCVVLNSHRPRTFAFVGGTGTFISVEADFFRSRIVPLNVGQRLESSPVRFAFIFQTAAISFASTAFFTCSKRSAFILSVISVTFLQELRWRFPLPLKAKWVETFFRRTSLVLVNLFVFVELESLIFNFAYASASAVWFWSSMIDLLLNIFETAKYSRSIFQPASFSRNRGRDIIENLWSFDLGFYLLHVYHRSPLRNFVVFHGFPRFRPLVIESSPWSRRVFRPSLIQEIDEVIWFVKIILDVLFHWLDCFLTFFFKPQIRTNDFTFRRYFFFSFTDCLGDLLFAFMSSAFSSRSALSFWISLTSKFLHFSRRAFTFMTVAFFPILLFIDLISQFPIWLRRFFFEFLVCFWNCFGLLSILLQSDSFCFIKVPNFFSSKPRNLFLCFLWHCVTFHQ